MSDQNRSSKIQQILETAAMVADSHDSQATAEALRDCSKEIARLIWESEALKSERAAIREALRIMTDRVNSLNPHVSLWRNSFDLVVKERDALYDACVLSKSSLIYVNAAHPETSGRILRNEAILAIDSALKVCRGGE